MFDFNLIKKFTLKVKSLFKYEKHEDKSKSLLRSTVQTNVFIMENNPLVKEVLISLPKSRQDNVLNIIKKTHQIVDSEVKANSKIKPPETEWLGPFLDHCKDVRSEDLQDIWSKILSGKMNRKNNTSIRTMSVLSKINSSEAKLFNQFLKYRIEHYVYYESNKMPADFLTFSEISLLLEADLVKQMVNVGSVIKPFRSEFRIGFLGSYYGYLLFVDFKSEQKEVRIPSVFYLMLV